MRKQINEILRYPEDSAGSIMTTEYVSLRPNMTVGEAILRIRRTGIDKETIYTCYVTKGHKLIGTGLGQGRCFCVRMTTRLIESIMTGPRHHREHAGRPGAGRADVLEIRFSGAAGRRHGKPSRRHRHLRRRHGTSWRTRPRRIWKRWRLCCPSEHPYLRSSPFEIWKNRIPWLLLLMISATLTGTGHLQALKTALGVLPCLTAFIPMLMDTGGNSGSQACVTVIRGISLDEIEFRDIVQGRLERDPRGGALRYLPGGGLLREGHAGRPSAAANPRSVTTHGSRSS